MFQPQGKKAGEQSLHFSPAVTSVALRDTLGSLKVVKKKVFADERWSQSRVVTAMDWSTSVSGPFSSSPDASDLLTSILSCF